jgi:hypothetical protein
MNNTSDICLDADDVVILQRPPKFYTGVLYNVIDIKIRMGDIEGKLLPDERTNIRLICIISIFWGSRSLIDEPCILEVW